MRSTTRVSLGATIAWVTTTLVTAVVLRHRTTIGINPATIAAARHINHRLRDLPSD